MTNPEFTARMLFAEHMEKHNNEFAAKMLYAKHMKKHDDRKEYWAGYIRGLKRRYRKEEIGTTEEHERWMNLIYERDKVQVDNGQGYRDAISEVVVHQVVCFRCRYEWQPVGAKQPNICPKCKSSYWNEVENPERGGFGKGKSTTFQAE